MTPAIRAAIANLAREIALNAAHNGLNAMEVVDHLNVEDEVIEHVLNPLQPKEYQAVMQVSQFGPGSGWSAQVVLSTGTDRLAVESFIERSSTDKRAEEVRSALLKLFPKRPVVSVAMKPVY